MDSPASPSEPAAAPVTAWARNEGAGQAGAAGEPETASRSQAAGQVGAAAASKAAPPTHPQTPGLSRGLVTLIAVATGAIVANLYYAQPVLHQVAQAFHAGPGPTSTIITATQVGYAAGLLLVVPLGDLHPRRALVTRLFGVATIALVACALAPTLWFFAVASVAVGAASVAGQVMIPFAADLAPEERRGRVVARIMSGLLTGILLARTVSGLVAQAAGWRAIYWISAALMVLFAVVLWRALPAEAARPHRSYAHLVGSSLRLLVTEPVLRRRCWHGACAFAAFSVLWTTLAFLLSGSPYHYSNAVIGLFGLVGVGGIAAANLAGKLADSARVAFTTVASGVLLAGSFALLWDGHTSQGALIAGIVVLDMGTQGMQITNQSVIYALRPDARSRINSAYMVCYFVGGAVGSFAAGALYGAHGWAGVCLLGAAFGLGTLLLSAYDRLRPPRAAAHRAPGPGAPTVASRST
jgi:predicted MFS family arabinose efflux permease